jgi:hypothetical protein
MQLGACTEMAQHEQGHSTSKKKKT